MTWKRIAVLVLGVILVPLGVLWFLQGSDIVHIKPILCFTDCEPVVGRSPTWQIHGILAFLLGAGLIMMSLFVLRKRR